MLYLHMIRNRIENYSLLYHEMSQVFWASPDFAQNNKIFYFRITESMAMQSETEFLKKRKYMYCFDLRKIRKTKRGQNKNGKLGFWPFGCYVNLAVSEFRRFIRPSLIAETVSYFYFSIFRNILARSLVFCFAVYGVWEILLVK